MNALNLTRAEERAQQACEFVDRMSPELRECVHEFSLSIVIACLTQGIRSPRAIRHLVKEIWAGARQPTQSSGAYETLDWVLAQAGAEISARKLRRILAEYSLVIVPLSPTRKMIAASMGEVSSFTERVTKQQKHARRLSAALKAAASEFLVADKSKAPHLTILPRRQPTSESESDRQSDLCPLSRVSTGEDG